MKEEFCKLYNEIIDSGDERKMEVLGGVVKKMMFKMIETSPSLARDYIDEMHAVRWHNYLTAKEAQTIVAAMDPKPAWKLEQWQSEMKSNGLATEDKPTFNEYALFVTMSMVSSDSGDTLAAILSMNQNLLLRPIYKLAIDKLKDKDGRFNVRRYFEV